MEAQKHTCLHVFSPFSAHFTPRYIITDKGLLSRGRKLSQRVYLLVLMPGRNHLFFRCRGFLSTLLPAVSLHLCQIVRLSVDILYLVIHHVPESLGGGERERARRCLEIPPTTLYTHTCMVKLYTYLWVQPPNHPNSSLSHRHGVRNKPAGLRQWSCVPHSDPPRPSPVPSIALASCS